MPNTLLNSATLVYESLYWLELLKETEYISEKEFGSINEDAQELLKILKVL
jgi:hypothetical protein